VPEAEVGRRSELLADSPPAWIFLSGGIIGTCHHLYFSGTPTVALAWGSVFSALEVVPLVLVGYDAMEDLRRSRGDTVFAARAVALAVFVAGLKIGYSFKNRNEPNGGSSTNTIGESEEANSKARSMANA
jgi:nitric oxide reductase large subunit